MSDFFFKNPIGKLLFDIAVGGVIGAASALLDLGPAATLDETTAAISTAAILGIRSAASTALIAVLRILRERPQ